MLGALDQRDRTGHVEALVRLPGRDVGRDLLHRQHAVDRVGHAWGQRRGQVAGADEDRGDVDLRAARLDGAHHRSGDRLGRLGPVAPDAGARLGEHAGVADQAREDDRHADAGPVEVLPQRRGEAAQPELRGGVDPRAVRRLLAGHRGHEHDVAAAALGHAGDGGLGQEHRRAEVDVEHAVDLLGRVLLDAAAARHGRVGDEDVRGASLLVGKPRDRLAIREVAGHRASAELRGERLEHAGAPPGQDERRRRAPPGRARSRDRCPRSPR